jgi:Domain of unknown function (DUF4468) with TBP-like fold
MKSLLFLCVLLLPVITNAASCTDYAKELGVQIDPTSSNVVYQEVVTIEGATAADIYSRAKAAIAVSYKSAQDVVQLDDGEAKRIIAKGTFDASGAMMTSSRFIRHTLTIEAKDGRYRISLSDLVSEFLGSQFAPPSSQPVEKVLEYSSCFGNKGFVKAIHEGALEVFSTVKAEMSKASTAGDDNW